MLKTIKQSKWWFYIPLISIFFINKMIQWNFEDEENYHNRYILSLFLFSINFSFSVNLIIFLTILTFFKL
jgi:hypothetical protein